MSQNDHTGMSVEQLVQAAREGDPSAWTAIVQRYGELIRSVARRYRLAPADIDDVSQFVWLKLFDHIDRIREPRALPGWIATTAANACLSVVKSQFRAIPTDPVTLSQRDEATWPLTMAHESSEPTAVLLRREDWQFLYEGLDELPPEQRDLLILLVADPPLSYQQISEQIGRPIGSIGPTRARTLERLRNTKAVRAMTLIEEPVAHKSLAA
jgi:RNA polymerase sigma factor (sigma-70 family)